MVGGGSKHVGEGSKPRATKDDAYAYLRAVRAKFHNDSKKYDDFVAVMTNFKARRDGCIKEVEQLLKGHRDLISGFNAFLPKCLEIKNYYFGAGEDLEVVYTAKRKLLARSDSKVNFTPWLEEAYHRRFRDEPAKYRQFLSLLRDRRARRIDKATFFVGLVELIKDHLDLLLGFNALLPARFQIPITPAGFQNVVGRSVPPETTIEDATSYLNSVKRAFHDEPAKYEELLKLLNDIEARRVDAASFIASVEELMKDHQTLLNGFSVFLSAEMKFIRKLKGDGSHVADSVLQILRMYSEGNKSKSEAFQEVVPLVQDHEDLVMELIKIIFSDP
ncbi:F17L21.4 [Arabidopsis thaliana]|uniref:F17L21.4 n=1 Tax=Arabidopsis thaliana TaxID=3702 RepID=Q9FZL0_ARATH|nr:F17L21.4 [Arabidopsis thaliana]